MGERETTWDEGRRAALYFSWAGAIASILVVALLDARSLDWRPWLALAAFNGACLGLLLIVPRLPHGAALLVFAVEAGFALALIWLTADLLATTERPFAPFNGNKILALLVAIFCPSLLLGTALICVAFVVPIVQSTLWDPDVHTQMPELEPYQTLVIGASALVFLHIRRRHARRIEELTRIAADRTALERVAEVGLHVRDRMQVLIGDLWHGLAALEQRGPTTVAVVQRMERAVSNLDRVRETLMPLHVAQLETSTRAADAATTEARRATLAVGVLATSAGVLFVFVQQIGFADYPGLPAQLIAISGIAALVVALVPRHASARVYHAQFAVTTLCCAAAILLNNDAMAARGYFDAFPGLKLGMLMFAFIAPNGLIGAAIIGASLVGVLVETYVLWSPEQRAHLPLLEPWSTVLIGLTALGLLYAQRRRTAAARELEAARSERDALTRTAHLVLALRDLVNTPLQILVISSELISTTVNADDANTIELAVARLRELIRALPSYDAETARRPDALAFHALDAIEHEVRRVTAAHTPLRAAS